MNEEERRNLYMQNPFDILTKEKLDRLERHCKKTIHYERGHIQEEHQITLELIYKYQEQQVELEKKGKIIDETIGYIATRSWAVCPNEECGANLDCENRCKADDNIYEECWRMYFERKIK